MINAQFAANQPSRPISTWSWLLWLAVASVVGIVSVSAQLTQLLILATGCIVVIAVVTHPLAAIAPLLILAPLRTLYATEAPRLGLPALPLDIGQWLVFAFIVSWVLHLVRAQRFPYWVSRNAFRTMLGVMAPLFIFIVAAAASSFSAHSLSAWLTEWLKWLQIGVLALIVADLCMHNDRKTIITLLIIAGVGNALIGIYQYLGGSGALHLLINERHFRAFGTFGQPNPFGGFMGILFPVAITSCFSASYGVSLAVRQSRRPLYAAKLLVQTLLFGASAGAIAVALIMSWSRGAWLGFGIASGVMLFALPRRITHSLMLTGVLLAVIVALAASGRLPASLSARLSTITEDIFNVQDVRGVDITPANYAVIERLAHWQAAINMATENPWFGVGLGNYEIAYADYRLANWKFALGHAHNTYLNMLAEVGLFGVVTYLAFICSILWYSWRCRRHPSYEVRLISIGILGMWVYLIIHSLTDNLYVNNVFIHLSVTIGILASIIREIPSRLTS